MCSKTSAGFHATLAPCSEGMSSTRQQRYIWGATASCGPAPALSRGLDYTTRVPGPKSPPPALPEQSLPKRRDGVLFDPTSVSIYPRTTKLEEESPLRAPEDRHED